MRKLFSIGIIFVSNIALGQSQFAIDSVADQVCKAIKLQSKQSDSAKLLRVFENDIFPFLLNYAEKKREDIYNHIYLRLQRNCKTFFEITARLFPSKGDWRSITKKPKSVLNKTDCQRFLQYSKYSYLEYSGDTVNLTIQNGYWIDHLKDGTYSKLEVSWISDCEFEATFIDSNNEWRKFYSIPGDKYRYQIVSKGKGYYNMTVQIVGSGILSSFKIYY